MKAVGQLNNRMRRNIVALLGGRNVIILGLVLVVVGWLYMKWLIVAGLLAALYGLYQMKNSDVDSDLNEEELRNKVILHTLARMTNADSNVMHVEVEAVQKTYKSITGAEITSKDIRVAALGELYEERPFCSYLKKAESRISVENKKKIMKALATIMKSDGVVNPLEVEFFNTVGTCLNMQAGDLLNINAD